MSKACGKYILLGIVLAFVLNITIVKERVYAEQGIIQDANLERLIRVALNQKDGIITDEHMKRLTSLESMNENKIVNLKGLEFAVNLKTLVLRNNLIKDIGPLSQLTQLEKVDLRMNRIEDLTPLSKLSHLTELRFSQNYIVDISPLASLSKLQTLQIDSNDINDFSTLRNFTHLKDLIITIDQNQNISPLQELNELNMLVIVSSQNIDLAKLAMLKLKDIRLVETKIKDITALKQMKTLKSIHLFKNPLNARSEEMLKDLRDQGVRVNKMGGSDPYIRVYIDKKQVHFSKEFPIIISGNTLIPLRIIFEFLGAKVDWEEETKTITAVKGNTTIKLQIGNNVAQVNGNLKTLNLSPQLINGSTMVPLRFVTEAFGSNVQWDQENYKIHITTETTALKTMDTIESSQILEAATTATSKLKSLKANIVLKKKTDLMDGLAIEGTFKFDMDVVLKPNLEIAGKMMVGLLGENMSQDFIFHEKKLYTKNIKTNMWEKRSASIPDEFLSEEQFNPAKQVEMFKTYSSQFHVKDNGKDYELTMIASNERLKEFALDKFRELYLESLGDNIQKSNITLNKLEYTLNFDKLTNQVKRLSTSIDIEILEKGEKSDFEYSIEVKYSNYDGIEEISIPQELAQLQ